MTREQLALLLENEAHLTAAERIRCGESPARVLSDLRPFVSRYNDAISREAVTTFQDVIAGRLALEP